MPRIALLVEYCGKQFSGSQYQPGVRTVQGDLEKAIATLARKPLSVTFSGRTDAGVHALGQVAHVDWLNEEVDLYRFCSGLNGILKEDVSVSKVQIVPQSFHARFSAIQRQYVYRICNRPHRSALFRDTHYFVPQMLDVEKMACALVSVIGDHDFAAFKSSNSDTLTTRCQLYQAELLKLSEGVLEIRIAANHFVYNMVRIIVGTLVEIGLGKKGPEIFSEALTKKNRDLLGPTAPPWGLTLELIKYPDLYQLFPLESK